MKFSPKQAATYAGVSLSMIYKWCSEGRLPHYRFGATGRRGKLMIDQADLDRVIADCRVTEPPDDEDLEYIK